jgi:hypothetical protein
MVYIGIGEQQRVQASVEAKGFQAWKLSSCSFDARFLNKA